MQFTALEISFMLDGTVDGDPSVSVNQLAKIEEATQGSLSFLANPKYEPFLYTTQASVVIINKDLVLTGPVTPTLIRVENAYSAFTVLLEKYNTIKMNKTGVEQPSFIHPTAKIGKNAYIGAFAYIGPHVVVGGRGIWCGQPLDINVVVVKSRPAGTPVCSARVGAGTGHQPAVAVRIRREGNVVSEVVHRCVFRHREHPIVLVAV